MNVRTKATRRGFLRGAGVIGAGLALPSFLRSAVTASPAETVVTGHVGIGGRGGHLLRWVKGYGDTKIAAVCDVDRAHRLRAKSAADGADDYGNHLRIIERKDIDAVVVATPDHWHAPVTIQACSAGKDVYVEKPSSHNVAEGREMVRAARGNERVVQVGIHHRSAEYNREISRIIRGGRIGKVHAVKCWMWDNVRKPRTPPTGVPEGLDFDRWLGPAPDVLYHPDRVHYNFRWCRDYAGGYMTDWGVHMLNMVTCAMKIDLKGPESVEATGEFAADNLYDFPTTMDARWVYKDPDFVLSWHQPSDEGDVLPGQQKGRRHGMTFYGEDGELRTGFGNGYHKFFRDGKELPFPRDGKSVDVPQSPGHMRNWLDCVKSREKPVADIEIGHRTTSICLLANIAMFSGKRKLDWNWREEKFIGDAEADGWLSRKARPGFAV